jgi:protease I
MKKIYLFAGIIAIIIIGGAAYFNFAQPKALENDNNPSSDGSATSVEETIESETNTGDAVIPEEDPRVTVTKASEGKIIAMVIAFKNFRDEEYFVPKDLFTVAGGIVKTISTEKGIASGADGGQVAVDFLISEVNLDSFDAVVFVGGPGTFEYLDNSNVYDLINSAISKKKLVGAICAAPAVLAKAGALQGKQATVWTSSMDKSLVKVLEDNGATYIEKQVVVDGLIITGSCPEAADAFGMSIIEALM